MIRIKTPEAISEFNFSVFPSDFKQITLNSQKQLNLMHASSLGLFFTCSLLVLILLLVSINTVNA